MKNFTHLPRRTFLKGVGATMALPMLEAMLPKLATAESIAEQTPVRMAFLFFPNGAIMPHWKPLGEGPELQLNKTMQPLEPLRSKLNVFTGLTQHHGRANGDGAGDHARNAGSFLTGAQPFKTAGANIRVGQSVDQAAAEHLGKYTKLPSLELGIDRGRNAGNCDSGYSCAYSNNISWKTESTPMAKEINPKLAFERLFGSTESSRERREREKYRSSILDLVREDASLLQRQLGKTDRQKIDEYFSSVRDLEVRIEQSATKAAEVPEYDVPEGIPRELKSHIRLMYDIMWLAFQTDSTRVCSFMLGNAGSNRSYPEIGVNDGHHSMSHHRNDEAKMNDIQKIDQYLVEQFVYFLQRLDSVQEGDRTLLDNSMILYGSAIADGNRHTHHDLPIIVAGQGGGRIAGGRHLAYPENTPLNNLFVSMCQQAGTPIQQLGDSTGQLEGWIV